MNTEQSWNDLRDFIERHEQIHIPLTTSAELLRLKARAILENMLVGKKVIVMENPETNGFVGIVSSVQITKSSTELLGDDKIIVYVQDLDDNCCVLDIEPQYITIDGGVL